MEMLLKRDTSHFFPLLFFAMVSILKQPNVWVHLHASLMNFILYVYYSFLFILLYFEIHVVELRYLNSVIFCIHPSEPYQYTNLMYINTYHRMDINAFALCINFECKYQNHLDALQSHVFASIIGVFAIPSKWPWR